MEDSFIDKIKQIVLDHLDDEKFGVSDLVSKIGLSKSQTFRKVKSLTNKSINQLIKEIRLQEAAKLILESDLHASEISYKVGFSSPSYFNKCFSKYYGITPGEYKEKYKDNLPINGFEQKTSPSGVKKFQAIFYILGAAILLFAIISVIKSKNPIVNISPDEISIAVLPFRNLSPEDNQWFCDGVTDNILTYLSQIKGLTVISFTSSRTYREKDKQIPQIAKELGVSYILEGSVTIHEGKIKINTQLINANNEHVWSEDYITTFEDVIALQQNVSKEIAKELKITLSPDEALALEKYPTEDMEAYHLFLKGRLVNNSRKKEDLELNIELNKQAIALDSNFAEAYAEVAGSYLHLSTYYGFDAFDAFEGLELSHKYAEKALQINPNNYRANAIKALLLWFKDWDKAKEYHEKAIALNPNDAIAHVQYGIYFMRCPNPDPNNYLKYSRIAQRLDPFSLPVGRAFSKALIVNNKFKEVEEYLMKMEFLFSEQDKLVNEYLIIAHKNKDCSKVIPFLEAKIEKDPNNSLLYKMLATAYDAVLNDDRNAIKYAKKAYEIDSTNSGNARSYLSHLVEGEKFKEAKILLQSKNFKSVVSEHQQLWGLWYYYYHQENYKKALEVAKDSLIAYKYFVRRITYAQLGNRKKVDILNKKDLSFRSNSSTQRAFVWAILKDRDSMYYYLENRNNDFKMNFPNSRREFDLYRKEERFKELLKKNYLPLTHWNE